MPDIQETQLPGVGVRFEFSTEAGNRLGVLVHKGGRRELMIYSSDDPDRCSTVLKLSIDDTRALTELLGASRISEVTTAVEQDIEGLSIDWLSLPRTSPIAGSSIAQTQFRTRTGVSIVAVLRDDQTYPAPTPDFVLEGGDVVVAVGTPPDLDSARTLLSP